MTRTERRQEARRVEAQAASDRREMAYNDGMSRHEARKLKAGLRALKRRAARMRDADCKAVGIPTPPERIAFWVRRNAWRV